MRYRLELRNYCADSIIEHESVSRVLQEMSDFFLKDQVIVVTGAAGGIGRAICEDLSEAGAKIVLAGRNADTLKETADSLKIADSLIVSTDNTKPESVKSLLDATLAKFTRVDGLVNNAGGGSSMKKPEETPHEEWVRMIDFNLTGTFNCCIEFGKHMISQKYGKIVNISSVAGTKGNPFMLHYSAAKAGVISLTNNLSFMWAEHNICVNTVVPGLIATPNMIKWGAVPDSTDENNDPVPRLTLPPAPSDVAGLCRYLLSPAADMITGETIPVRSWFRSDRFWN